MSGEEFLAWIDLETTGLDPEVDLVIEVAMIVTDLELNQLAAFESPVLPWRTDDTSDLLRYIDSNCIPLVKEMHTESGLINAIGSGIILDETTVLQQIDKILEEVSEGAPGKFLVAGSGVASFDVLFMRKRWPQLMANHFSYQCIDIGQIRRFLGMVVGREDLSPEFQGQQHRALPDVRNFLTQARAYRNVFSKVVK